MSDLKIPPHCIESEMCVIGSILLDSYKAIEKCVDVGIRSEMFYDRRHQVLFDTAIELNRDNEPIDPMSIRTKLADLGISDRTGGDDYLIELQDTAIVPAHVTFYSRKILEKFRRREIIEAASSVLNDAYDDDDISTALEKIQSIGICDAGERRKPQIISEAKDLSDKMSIGHAVGIPTPFAKFNRKTFGLPRGVVCPLAGRGGKGKSMLKSYLTSSFIMQGIPTLDFCLEDGDVKSANRLAACIGEYDLFRLNRGNVSSEYMATHNKCLDQIGSLPYFPHQDGGTVEDIVIKIGRFMRENESSIRSSGGIVFIDGIKDVIASKGENKTSQEEHISQTLARCAVKHRDITIIPVSHLTKLDEGVWITLNDIRGSALQVANARAALIFQDSGFDAETNAAANFDENTVVLEMAKSNYGNPGRVILRKEFERGRFTEVSND